MCSCQTTSSDCSNNKFNLSKARLKKLNSKEIHCEFLCHKSRLLLRLNERVQHRRLDLLSDRLLYDRLLSDQYLTFMQFFSL